jgi:hypothetical protein
MRIRFIVLGLAIALTSGCVSKPPQVPVHESPTRADPNPGIPQMIAMPDPPRENIRQTCRERWPIEKMNMKTFHVKPDGDEFVIRCEGTFDGEVYQCVIRTDSQGHWINDGRTKKNP